MYKYLFIIISIFSCIDTDAQIFQGGNGSGSLAFCYTQANLAELPIYAGSTGSGAIVVCAGTLSPMPLPVQLTSFNAIPVGKNILLSWATASEINNQSFTIERSLNGTTWDAIGKLNGAGNSNQLRSYEFTDTDPRQGIQYYRLKQTDLNGAVKYSAIRTVSFNGASTHQVKVFPNPINDVFTVTIAGNKIAKASVQLVTVSGQIVLERSNLRGNVFYINSPSLASGQYILIVRADDQTTHINVWKK